MGGNDFPPVKKKSVLLTLAITQIQFPIPSRPRSAAKPRVASHARSSPLVQTSRQQITHLRHSGCDTSLRFSSNEMAFKCTRKPISVPSGLLEDPWCYV